MSGVLYGVGVGPGDPDLLTLKAARVIAEADVVAYPANPHGHSLARTIAAAHLRPGVAELPMVMDFAPDRRQALAAYDQGAAEIAGHLAAGRTVAVLCEGDPLLYGSFTYVLERLPGADVRIVPGVSALTACAGVAAQPLVQGDEALVCAPATLPEDALARLLAAAPACALFKVGRHLDKVARVLAAAGLAEGAVCVVRAGQAGEARLSLAAAQAEGVPYFTMILSRRACR